MDYQEDHQFTKDEEKDINLLLSRIWKDPSNFKERIEEKLNEFQKLQNQVTQNP